MNNNITQLIEAARDVCGDFSLAEDFSAGGVGAAIRTVSGKVYTGICIDLACGLGFCAEVAAIAEMLKNRETHITQIVAVSDSCILPPCGRCRETMAQIDVRNLDAEIILDATRTVSLRQLLPEHWLSKNHR
jgi:cytidine deaminase